MTAAATNETQDIVPSELERYREGAAMPPIFEDAPGPFRTQLISLMQELVGWKTLGIITLENYSDGAPDHRILACNDWLDDPSGSPFDPDPSDEYRAVLHGCEWWRFLLIVQSVSSYPTRAEKEVADAFPEFVHDDPERWDLDWGKALHKENEFEASVNRLLAASRLGYRLHQRMIVSLDLRNAERLKEQVADSTASPQIRENLQLAYGALNSLPKPDLRAAIMYARLIIEEIEGPFARFTQTEGPSSPAKVMRNGMIKIKGAASQLGPHQDSKHGPTRSDAIGLVAFAAAFAAYADAILHDQEQDDSSP